ncbi:MAG: PAS domain-containing sensor histidine kinase [Ignavibacteriales bacterium]|nr:PAS domain-containing sensor histidine kinase [Ignavibacteriales bacterium]
MKTIQKSSGLSSVQWQAVFDGVKEYICLIDTDYRIITINRATEIFLQKTASEVTGLHCWEVFHNDGHPRINCPACKMCPVHERTEMVFQEGSHWFNVSLDPYYDNQGLQAGILHIIRDITALKLSEIALKEKQLELQKSNESKESLFSIIAHDLRGPFHALLNISKILSTEDEDLTKEEHVRFSETLHFEIEQVYKLLEDLLLWGNIKKGATVMDPEQNDIKATILTCINVERPVADSKGIQFDTRDVNSLLAEKITLSSNIVESFLQIRVQDSGIGVSGDKLKSIETTLLNESTDGTENEKGRGLGLKLVCEFIKLHHGNISIQSEPNKGSIFVVTLPVEQ